MTAILTHALLVIGPEGGVCRPRDVAGEGGGEGEGERGQDGRVLRAIAIKNERIGNQKHTSERHARLGCEKEERRGKSEEREGGKEQLGKGRVGAAPSPAHDEFDGKHRAFLPDAGVWVRNGKDVVGHQIFTLLEPPEEGRGRGRGEVFVRSEQQ